jgi:Zn-dependent protease with chaperone function
MDKTYLTGITPQSFAHPYDLAGLEALAKVPILPEFIGFMAKYFGEIPRTVELLSESIKVTPRNYGKIHDLLIESCKILDMSPPPLFVLQRYEANAYTIGLQNPLICIYTGLIDILNEKEIQCVIAHELGHIKAMHVLYRGMVSLATTGIAELFLSKIPFAGAALTGMSVALLSWLRKCELTADRASLLVTQDPEVPVSLCMKLAGGVQRNDLELSTEDFLDQSRELEGIISGSVVAKISFWMHALEASHPLPVPRAAFIHDWGQTDQYKQILNGKFKKCMIRKCPNCEHDISTENNVCPFCLVKFKKNVFNVIRCRNCSTSIDKSEFQSDKKLTTCPNCGEPLESGVNIFNRFEWLL